MRAIQSGILVLCFLGAAAAARATDSPEDVVRAFALAIQADGPAATVPRFTHPDELARFKRMFMPRIRKSAGNPGDKFIEETLGRKMPLEKIEAMPPAEFMAAFLRRGQVDGSKFQPPRFVSSTRAGDIVHLVVVTDLVSLDGVPTQRRESLSLKAMGDTWKMMLSREIEAYATVLIAGARE